MLESQVTDQRTQEGIAGLIADREAEKSALSGKE